MLNFLQLCVTGSYKNDVLREAMNNLNTIFLVFGVCDLYVKKFLKDFISPFFTLVMYVNFFGPFYFILYAFFFGFVFFMIFILRKNLLKICGNVYFLPNN